MVNFAVRFDNISNPFADLALIEAETRKRIDGTFPSTLEEQFRWTNVKGADGWWATLMGGVWINGEKVIRNLPVLLDINSPFMLAPPAAAKQFYQGIRAAKRQHKPHGNNLGFKVVILAF